jgi:hypothetical protein
MESRRVIIPIDSGTISANRWIIGKNNQKAMVLYWYQGRGRTESHEYRVKLDLIRDAALRRRSEEALVRLFVPILPNGVDVDSLASRAVRELAPHLKRILPS